MLFLNLNLYKKSGFKIVGTFPNYRRDDNKFLNFKYRYLIKDKNTYRCSFLLKYNKKNYKYFFDITSNEINNYETDWDINAKIRIDEDNKKNDMKINLMNWIKYNTNDNVLTTNSQIDVSCHWKSVDLEERDKLAPLIIEAAMCP